MPLGLSGHTLTSDEHRVFGCAHRVPGPEVPDAAFGRCLMHANAGDLKLASGYGPVGDGVTRPLQRVSEERLEGPLRR